MYTIYTCLLWRYFINNKVPIKLHNKRGRVEIGNYMTHKFIEAIY